jgi:hypothetical protein
MAVAFPITVGRFCCNNPFIRVSKSTAGWLSSVEVEGGFTARFVGFVRRVETRVIAASFF